MEKIINKFQVKYLQILDENGKCDEKLKPKLTSALIKQMYEYMILTRVFDEKALKLQRQGRLGTYAQTLGQEACQIGSGLCIKNEDFVFPAFRENGVYMLRGMPIEMLFEFWAGDERGMQIPKNVNMFPITITVGAHLPHAVGTAMAFQYQKKRGAVITYFGDGATSEGDFHEAMNFAGTFKAPVVFICQNNQWAISVPVEEQTASETLAQKAIAYGFEGIKVDGNDVFAVYKATQEALKKARSGKGPTLIECFTYRMADHTTSDDAKKYRKESEVKKWAKRDPISRLKKYMIKKKIFSEKYEKEVLARAEKQIDVAVEKAESIPRYKPEEIFNYMYETLTPDLKEQQEKMKEDLDSGVKEEDKAEEVKEVK
ncbi:MAG: pyruvate dehydrogenase (acetyl-transferring) E1 component subunit alpha [Nanoarchaeota archaeon]|nr:pyruvate dehydrogenase (acetyl-transferring) E1 component subunit alpha [Nanoarchaeota archaeon]